MGYRRGSEQIMHRHACDYGHFWDCEGTAIRSGDSEPTICMCFDHHVPMDDGKHEGCATEIIRCPEHRAEQTMTPDGMLPIKEDEVEDGFVPVQIPDNLEEMFESWAADPEPSIGLCLMCGQPIRSEADMIPGTSSHNCAEGMAFHEKIMKQSGGSSSNESRM